MKFLKILFWIVLGILGIQLIPINRTVKPVNKKVDFVEVMKTPPEITLILKNACYDCHSNETKYPTYAKIAPISWAIQNHVVRGRKHLNFSEWNTFNQDLKKNMLESSAADMRQNRMPLAGYMVYHPEARLTNAQKLMLAEYFENILKSGKY